MDQVHPVLSHLRQAGKTQRWLVGRVNERGVSLSPPHLCDIISGRRRPSPMMAEAIAAALENEVTPAAIVFWKPPSVPPAPAPTEPTLDLDPEQPPRGAAEVEAAARGAVG